MEALVPRHVRALNPSVVTLDASLPASKPVRRPFLGAAAGLPALLIWGTVGLLVLLPLALVFVQAVMPALFDIHHPSVALSLDSFRAILTSSRLAAGMLNTLAFGAAVAIGATVLGGGLAVLLVLTNVRGARWWMGIPWAVVATPSFLKGLAFVLLLSPGGYLVQLDLLSPDTARQAFGGIGLFVVMTLSLFAFPYFIVAARLSGMGGELIDAARLAGAGSWRILFRIVLPLLTPAVALAALTTFAEAIGDYGLAATVAQSMNVGLLTATISNATTEYPPDFAAAAAGSVVLAVLVTLTVVASLAMGGGHRLALLSGRSRPTRAIAMGATGQVLAFVGLAMLAGFSIVLPLAAVVVRATTRSLSAGIDPGNWSLAAIRALAAADGAERQPLVDSVGYAAVTAVLVCAFAIVLALAVWRLPARARGPVLGAALAIRSLPGIILGFGYILLVNRVPVFDGLGLYGTRALLVAGYCASALPLALLLVNAAVERLSPSIHDASRLCGASFLRHATRIVAPLVKTALFATLALTFVRVFFELPISRLLMPLAGPPFSVIVVSHFIQDRDMRACAMALAALVGLAILAAATRLVPWAVGRLGRATMPPARAPGSP